MKISAAGIQIERISLPRMAWLCVAMIMFWHLCYVSSNSEHRDRIIRSDGAGYYAYLPAIFIYDDLQYGFCDPKNASHPDVLAANAQLFTNRTVSGKAINKYFIGTAILESPFFFIACAVAPMFGYEADGYSFPFQLAIAIAAIFYTLFGLDQLRRLLNKRGLPEYVQALVILLLFLGTNLYQYAMEDPGMSHVYSFAMVAWFLNLSHDLFHNPKKYSLLWVALALAAVLIIRPVNGLVILALPLVAGSGANLREGIRFSLANRRALAYSFAAVVFIVFLQLLVYYQTVGSWIVDSYNGEHIDFTNPFLLDVLFSWRKGFLIYTPLMIFAFAGVFLLKTNFERIAFLVFFLPVLWLISSWEQWWYGGGFGMRPFIDFYPVMAIPLATLVYAIARTWWARIVFTPVIVLLVTVNLIQHYQLAIGILPYDGLNEQRYERLFLETDPGYRFIYDPGVLAAHTMPDNAQLVSSRTRTFEEDTTWHTISWWAITNEMAFEGKNAVKLGKGQLTAGLGVMLKDAVPDSTLWSRTWIRIRSKIYLPNAAFGPSMAISIRSDGKEYYWDACPLYFKTEVLGRWQDFTYDVKLPPPPGGNVEACIFLVHGDQSVAYADNMVMEFWVQP